MSISGQVVGSGTHDIEARFNGGSWQTIASGVTSHFTGTLNAPDGFGALEIRGVGNTTQTATVNSVGVGDVYVIAGQSNASGRGWNNQVVTASGALMLANDYRWKLLSDPVDANVSPVDSVNSDAAAGGSVWPLLAQHFIDSEGVPIAFIPTARGGTSITAWQPGADHQDRTTLYGAMVYRALQVQNGVKGVLWWQGEQDAFDSMDQATYSGYLVALADAIATDLDAPLIAAKLQDSIETTESQEAEINNAIGANWGVGNVKAGPDLSDIVTDDSAHLQSDAKLQLAADRWWEALNVLFY